MGKARVVWTAEKYQRLLAATIAAHPGMKLNYHAIATIFGEGATYDTIETRFRTVKATGKQLAAEVASGERPAEATPTPRKRKAIAGDANPSPTKRKGVTKNITTIRKSSSHEGTPETPWKRKATAVKREMEDREDTPDEPWSAASDTEETEQEEVGFSF
ncbi:hypothetical protein K440DRAFT_633017 [Wilcoxina mikolae CBS 423.85]|nr:hypothetical protein K440DRAFT_633017 [Wilcoxina mikolae CBS 423.85]